MNSMTSVEGIKRSVNACNKALRNKKHIDLFELARRDTSRPIEEAIRNLKTVSEEGLFDHVGLSEVNADTLRRANSVHPISVVEIEVSPWSIEEETKKGRSSMSDKVCHYYANLCSIFFSTCYCCRARRDRGCICVRPI